MIVFDLRCLQSGDRFEAWFRSSADFDQQSERGLVLCPFCESNQVAKAPMAPMVPRRSVPGVEVVAQLAELQAELLRDSRWVGDRFADTARAMHSGEIDSRPVHGEATLEQARSLLDDDVPVVPLPLPVVPPSQLN
ncbi:DUF1178 family protein [Sphingomonas sp.]|uniref:DUF1178 family protein n=1 Tax=Sphingomonas sp. TaxID=28214 RepID=UPI0017DB07E5|nr:DUF1178 family protein [Sphingomonas sp.]MBA3512434.1 DUF1178 family protein [Sphingomonas sp.]